ncbi:MAG: hypothetical protein JXA10_04655 [Anaerolineae bacterium]|nr:hypothetical protein [Anaerolineae bacterium]
MSDVSKSRGSIKFPSQLEIAGIVLAAMPFVCTFSTTSTKTVNGRVVEESSTDYVAILAGLAAVGLAAAILATLFPNTAQEDRIKRIGAIVVIALLGAYQLLGPGLGVF